MRSFTIRLIKSGNARLAFGLSQKVRQVPRFKQFAIVAFLVIFFLPV